MRRRDFSCAVVLAETACRGGVADASVFGLLGHALSSLGRHEEAADAYAEALKLAPEDPYVRHLVRASGVASQETRAPPSYIEAVFDGYAERFEEHLIGLGYRVPGLFRAALLADRGRSPLADVLDLGCGTGLVGVALSDLNINRLVGVDLSSRMLEAARRKRIYAELRQDDIIAMLAGSAEAWDVILAADVANYFGEVDELLQLSYSRLRCGGLLFVSFEEMLAERSDVAASASPETTVRRQRTWKLHRQGRYCHDIDHLARAARAAGFEIRSMTRNALRREADAPVAGVIAVLARVAP